MPVLVVYSQEYRNYSLLIFLMVLSAWSLAVALRSNSPLWWTVFVGSTILNLYTHFVALAGVAALAVFALASLVWKAGRREPVKPFLASTIMAFAVIGIAYVPALPRLAQFTLAEAKDMGGPGPSYPELFRLAYVAFPGFGGWLSLLALGLAILGMVWSGFRSPRALLLLVVMIVVSVLPFEGHNHVATSPRYISFVMPFLAIAIGAGLAAITFAVEGLASRRWPGLQHVGVVATVVTSIMVLFASATPLSKVYATNPKQLPVDLREAFEYVRSRFRPNDLLLETSTAKGGSVYWFGTYNSYFLRPARWPRQPTKAFIDQGFPQGFKRHLDKTGRLWVLVTVADNERVSVQKRGDADFAVQCFRRICAIESRNSGPTDAGPAQHILRSLRRSRCGIFQTIRASSARRVGGQAPLNSHRFLGLAPDLAREIDEIAPPRRDRREVGLANYPLALLYRKFGHAEPFAVAPDDHLKIKGQIIRHGVDGEEPVPAHAAEAMEDIPDDGALAAPQQRRQRTKAKHKPFARPQEVVVFLVASALRHPRRNDQIVAAGEQRAEFQYGARIDAPLGVKHDQGIRRAIFERANVSLIVAGHGLIDDANTLGFEIGHGTVVAAAIDSIDLVKLVDRQVRDVMAAAVDLIQGKQTEADGGLG